jgi:hypothetical protein
MRWKDARVFFKKLAALATAIYGKNSAPATDTPATTDIVQPEPSFADRLFQNLPAIIEGSDDLVTTICTKSTELSADKFDELDQAAAMAVLQAALEVNYDEETKNCLAGIGAKLAALMPAKAKTT